ncbi:MAG TPA: AAA family ATPase [Thermomonas sp.]|nr:AAA family ATPase [Thermomonas sp.]
MYLSYFGLHEPPFSITPDPRFVHLSERHRDALAHLLFGIDKGGGGGFVQLTGEVGTGKTTLSRLLLERLPQDARVALVLNPRQNAVELLETICEELHINIDGRRGSSKSLVDILNSYLLVAYSKGLRVVLLIDEAQNLPTDALEQVRLLTNLETDTQKLLQILLLGQPELRAMVARPELRQLAQRITARYHLTPLDAKETGEYLRHRWRVAGGQKFPFEAKAVQRMHQRSGGVPRLLNVIAERALLAGYARDAATIDAKLVDAAANEVLPPVAKPRWWPWPATAAGIVAVALLAMQWRDTPAPPVPAAIAAAQVPQQAAKPAAARIETLDASALTQLLGATGDTPLPAWQALLGLWGLPAGSITVDPAGPCTSASRTDVHCVQGRSRLDVLLALDRPVLLRLQDGNANAWALLLGADARKARLRVGTRTFDLDRVLLQSRWDGEYAALWVGKPPAPAAREDIATFQEARGLPVDGIAGPLTRMALASDAAAGPHLLRVLQPN